MSSRRGLIIALAGLFVALIGIAIIAVILQRSLTPPPPPTPEPPITERILITTHDIALGSIIKAEDVTELEVPVGIAPVGALTNASAVIDRITKVQLVSGEMVMEHHLADPTNVSHDLAFIIEDEAVLMAFPSTDLMSQLNVLQRGDLVDILVSISQEVLPDEASPAVLLGEEEQETQEELFTFNALQRIEISAIVVDIIQTRQTGGTTTRTASAVADPEATPQPTPTPQPSQVESLAYLLAIKPQDALVLKHLKDAGGTFDIVLRAPTSESLFELSPVTSEYLIDRYGLEITR